MQEANAATGSRALNLLALAAFLALLTLVAIVARPLTPIDETRYVSVAWEMWLRGDFWVPFKNGVPYSDKPPLLLWLYQLGWGLFGVNDWWPRLVSPLASLTCMGLTAALARRLRRDLPEVARSAPWILASSLLWILFSTSAMFDVLLTVWVLLGIWGIWLASQGKGGRGFALLGVAIGMGVLAKGPVILLHVLPLAVLAPWWSPGLNWKRWYGGIVLSILIGAGIALAWALPAGYRGGAEFRHAIFWGQTANRMVDSFAHRRPFWWYLPLLPLLFYPWLVWPGLWRAVGAVFSTRLAPGMKFCLAWGVPVFVAFSLISGKQIHYLVPLFPMFALFSAQALAGRPQQLGGSGRVPGAILFLAGIAALWFALKGMPPGGDWAGGIPLWAGAGMIGFSLLWMGLGARLHWRHALVGLAFALTALVQLGIVRPLAPAYDVAPMAKHLKTLQEKGVAIAHEGKYHAQFQFAGRLMHPLEIVTSATLPAWFRQHPDGRVIIYVSSLRQALEAKPEFYQLYRGDVAVLVNQDQFAQLKGGALNEE